MSGKSPALIGSGKTDVTRFNALKHGVLSRHTVLGWEDAGEYKVLLEVLVTEHTPEGSTEEHLVEELAGVMWRKRRLRLAEGAAQRRGLRDSLEASHATVATALVCGSMRANRLPAPSRKTRPSKSRIWNMMSPRSAVRCFSSGHAATGLTTRRWRNCRTMCAMNGRRRRKASTPTPRASSASSRIACCRASRTGGRSWSIALPSASTCSGEIVDPGRLESLSRYQVHLDRKLERMLAMLFRLKELRVPVAS